MEAWNQAVGNFVGGPQVPGNLSQNGQFLKITLFKKPVIHKQQWILKNSLNMLLDQPAYL